MLSIEVSCLLGENVVLQTIAKDLEKNKRNVQNGNQKQEIMKSQKKLEKKLALQKEQIALLNKENAHLEKIVSMLFCSVKESCFPRHCKPDKPFDFDAFLKE